MKVDMSKNQLMNQIMGLLIDLPLNEALDKIIMDIQNLRFRKLYIGGGVTWSWNFYLATPEFFIQVICLTHWQLILILTLILVLKFFYDRYFRSQLLLLNVGWFVK